MPEESKASEDASKQNNAGDQKVTDTSKTDTGTQETFDPSKVGDEEFNKIFDDPRLWNHPRFKSLADAKKERDALKKKDDEEREAKLLEEKKFQELLAEKDKKISELTQAQQNLLIEGRVSTAAVNAGAADIETVLKLIDRSKLTLNEDGTVTGVEEAVKALLEAKPFLKGSMNAPTIGSGTNPGAAGNATAKRFRLSQLQDPRFYQDNLNDINQAFKLGLVEDDMSK